MSKYIRERLVAGSQVGEAIKDAANYFEVTEEIIRNEYYKLGMNWFKFWTYTWLPLGIFGTYFYSVIPTIPIIWKVYSWLLATVSIPIVIGLHKKRQWGWKLNLTVLTCNTIIMMSVYHYTWYYTDMWESHFHYLPDASTPFWWSFWIILWLLLFIAQYSYWKKRRHLFI